MTTSSVVGEALAKSLVNALGADCATAARVAGIVLGSKHSVLNSALLTNAPAGALKRVLQDFSSRGWVVATPSGWVVGPTAIPPSVPSFLQGAAAMRAALPQDGRATGVVTFPTAKGGLARVLPRTGFSYAGLVSTDEALDRIADAAVNTFTILTPFLNHEGLSYVLTLFQRTKSSRKILVVRRHGGALATVRSRLDDISKLGIDARNYTLPLPKGYETFHAKVVLADQDLAYVGSANMTRFDRRSMELGVMADGTAARVVASVVRAVELVADRISSGASSLSRSPSAG